MEPPKPRLDDLRIERRDRPEPRSRTGWGLLLLVLVVLGAAFVWWGKRGKVAEVRTVLAREARGDAAEHTVLDASGYVTARREATVSSKVTGKVTEVLVDEGMEVQEGQVLARLDDTNVKASLGLAEAQLDAARKALEETRVRIKEADQELKRQTDLVKGGIATQADYDHADAAALALKAKYDEQQAEVVVAERQVASWQQQLDDTIIRAPFSGIVTSKNAQPGEMISPISAGGGFTRTGICTVVDMQSLEVEVDVSENYINRVEPQQPVEATLDAYPDWNIPGKVIAIIPTADRQKSTVKVRVSFDHLERRILPEMSVKVAFRQPGNSGGTGASQARAVLVPKSAVREQNGRDVVLVVKNGRAETRAVKVSSSGEDMAAISSGLAAGERVAVDWPNGVGDGAAVKEVEGP